MQPTRLLTLHVLLLTAVVYLVFGATEASAHATPNSAMLLDFHDDGVTAELQLPLVELELAFGQPLAVNPAEVISRHESTLAAYVTRHIKPVAPDGRPWTVLVKSMDVPLDHQPVDLVVHLWLQPPAGAPVRTFTLHYDVIAHEVINHSALITVRNDWDNAINPANAEVAGAIRFQNYSVNINRQQGHGWRGFQSVFALGMEHISEGVDHLLFLLVLLLPAPLFARDHRWHGHAGIRFSLTCVLKIVTAFTLGHSITLVIGALGWLRVAGQPVEILIALSILVSAVHALRPLFPAREAYIAAGFGLIHGLAFASTIADMGLGLRQKALSILGFNLGIEVMQLAVVVVTLPWLLLLARSSLYARVRALGAGFAAIAAFGWLAERILERPNAVGGFVNSLSHHALWFLGALVLLALLSIRCPALKLAKSG